MNKISRLCRMLVFILALTNAVWAQTTLFQDDFNAATLNLTNWKRGDSSGNVKIQGNYLDVVSKHSGINGWIVTKQKYGATNVSASLKILNPGIESDLGLSPTSPSPTALNGLYSQSNYYRFYISGDKFAYLPPYSMYIYRKRSGESTETKRTKVPVVLPSPYDAGNTPFYIRIRLSEGLIYFEYSKDSCYWFVVYFERFDLPGSTASSLFYYEIAASNKLISGVPDTSRVDDFKIESYTAASYPATTILNDTLNSSTFNSSANPEVRRKVWGGSFTGGKWKPSSSPLNTNMIYYDLGRYIENGSLEIKVTKFYPTDQNTDDAVSDRKRHHVLSMFRQPWVGHHAVEDVDTFWDLHTGKQFLGGVKFLSNTYYSCDEFETRVLDDTTTTVTPRLWAKWVKSTTPYRLKITWDNLSLKYYRNDTLHAWHLLKNPMQLRYLCVGRDSTVSADLFTEFFNNQYPTMSDADGPLYSNLVVKELRPSPAAPVINGPTVVDRYQNAARISWSTTAPAVCYVRYGLTTSYNNITKVLGPPATAFTTLFSNLIADTTYHYKIYAEGEGGNSVQSADSTFRTATNGIYVFKPVADTYIEDNNTDQNDVKVRPWLYGPTRKHGNYGWMNLMTAESRDAFLQFNVAGVTGTINQETLRLYGRRTNAYTGASVKQFTPVLSNWELNATWDDATDERTYIDRSDYSGDPALDSFSSTTMGQWHSVNVSAATPSSNNYYFVLQGNGRAGDPGDKDAYLHGGSFDSRESPNNQPELIISTAQSAFTEISTPLPGVTYPALAWGDYDKDGDPDIVLTGFLGANAHSQIWKNNGNGTFATVDTMQAVYAGAAAWGDYDKNNNLDLLLTGNNAASVKYTKVYQNANGASFDSISTSLPALSYNGAAWGDYNNDRHVDILLGGTQTGGTGFAKIYKATSTGVWAVDSSITNLEPLKDADAEWGDYDRDGDLDVLLSGFTNASAKKIVVYKNRLVESGAASFELAYTATPQVLKRGTWVDYDQDGDLDISLAGEIHENTGSNFALKAFGIPNTLNGDSAWGDYDNDGDLDLLLTGEQGSIPVSVSKIYRNDFVLNVRTFVDIAAPLVGVKNSAVAWGDYDKDGDWDILLAGLSATGVRTTKLYRNNTSATNGLPAAPANLSATPPSLPAGGNVKLMWNRSTDNAPNPTPRNGLTYNVMMSAGTNLVGNVSPMSMTSNGRRLIPAPGNVGSDTSWTWSTAGLAPGTYNWKVQALDQTFKGSTFSANATFVITSGSSKIAETDSIAEAQQAIPKIFALSQNYPNPFNPSTRLNLDLPENGRVKAIIYNLTGQEVVRLQDGAMTAGYRYLNWDGRNKFGANVSSGFYLVKVVFEGVSGLRKESTSRVVLLK